MPERLLCARAQIEQELGVSLRELRDKRDGNPLACAIHRLALECDTQESAVELALQSQEATLAAVRHNRDQRGRIDARRLTGMPGAFLAGEMGELEGMLRALKVMIDIYKSEVKTCPSER